MDVVLRRSPFAVAAAVSLMFTVLLFGSTTPSAAASYTFHFNGAIGGCPGDLCGPLDVEDGNPVSGTITLDPFNTSPTTTTPSSSTFDQPSGSFTFHVTRPGKAGLDYSDSGPAGVASGGAPLPFRDFGFDLSGSNARLVLFFQTDANGPALLSLDKLPTTPGGLLSLLGGNITDAYGFLELNGVDRLEFAINAAPVPAALPLFATALGGLAFIGWRRRRAHSVG